MNEQQMAEIKKCRQRWLERLRKMDRTRGVCVYPKTTRGQWAQIKRDIEAFTRRYEVLNDDPKETLEAFLHMMETFAELDKRGGYAKANMEEYDDFRKVWDRIRKITRIINFYGELDLERYHDREIHKLCDDYNTNMRQSFDWVVCRLMKAVNGENNREKDKLKILFEGFLFYAKRSGANGWK